MTCDEEEKGKKPHIIPFNYLTQLQVCQKLESTSKFSDACHLFFSFFDTFSSLLKSILKLTVFLSLLFKVHTLDYLALCGLIYLINMYGNQYFNFCFLFVWSWLWGQLLTGSVFSYNTSSHVSPTHISSSLTW